MIAHIDKETGERQTVLSHLEGTAEIAGKIGRPLGIAHLCTLTAMLHDLGKWRVRFEEYLLAAVYGTERIRRGEVNHSSAGAVFLHDKYEKKKDLHKLTMELMANAIFSHHGLNDCLSPQGIDHFHRRLEKLEDLDYQEVLGNLSASPISEEYIEKTFEEAVKETEAVYKLAREKESKDATFYMSMLERLLLSVLIDADRLDTAIFCKERRAEEQFGNPAVIWEECISNMEHYLGGLKRGKLSEIRTRISNQCLEFADREPGIYRMFIPTGGGKTLSGLRYALNHAKRHGKKRIFYIGPYLSILEQNGEVFREALKREDIILEHHSNVLPDETGEGGLARYKHLTENWDHPIILTTFVQFLNTLFSGSTQSVRRFHNLSEAVIIIDEIQSLPIEMIYLFNLAMNFLGNVCGSTVILCSATQPVLDQVGKPIRMGSPKDMIPNVKELYRQLQRVKVEEKKGNFDTERLQEFVMRLLENKKSILVILNTKTAARVLFQALQKSLAEQEEPVFLVHLSTNMCAAHRLKYIQKIKEKLGSQKVICVSTSLIEAGVDLSFETVIRSYAGLDSIVQAAGRCNRNAENGMGIVYLINYEAENLGYLKQTAEGAASSKIIAKQYQEKPEKYDGDMMSPAALQEFYERYYYSDKQKRLMSYPLEKLGTSMLDLLKGNQKGTKAYQEKMQKNPDLVIRGAFQSAGDAFEVIAKNTIGVLAPYGEGKHIIERLNGSSTQAELAKELKAAQRYTVNLYRDQLEKLGKLEAVYQLKNIDVLVLKERFYDENLGISCEGDMEFLEI